VIGGCLEAAVRTGIRKFKFLGGEPLLRPDLPGIVEGLRRAAPEADLSLITGGVAPVENLERVFAAGLDRANLTIHGWGAEAFHRRGGTEDLRRLRDRNLEFLRRNGRPLKLNYVYSGPQDDEDLRSLLDVASRWGVLVNVLDDLSDPCASAMTVSRALRRIRGEYLVEEVDPDPDSLPTMHLEWEDGLRVEVKQARLGEVAPWKWCPECPKRERCREGIFALRLGFRGDLRLCMDRPDLTLPLEPLISRGIDAAAAAWNRFIDRSLP